MATPGVAANIVGLIGAACTLIQQVRSVKDKVKSASKVLETVPGQLQSLERPLVLVRDEEALQTAAVEQQVGGITLVAEELRSFLGALAVEQQKRPIPQLIHALKSGGSEEKQLTGILDRLDRARDLLVLRISIAQVGVVGNVRDGFRVAFGVLMEVDKKVNEMLGTNLVLAQRLKGKAPQQPAYGTIPLDGDDVDGLHGVNQPRTATWGTAATDVDATQICENIAIGQAHFMTGNVGVENWHRIARREVTIAKNIFGSDVRIMTGDQGGDAVNAFIDKFWN